MKIAKRWVRSSETPDTKTSRGKSRHPSGSS